MNLVEQIKQIEHLGLLQKGSQGERVEILQKTLKELEYNINIDGDFGPATQRIVVDFQENAGLVSDGIVGSQTWSIAKEKLRNLEQQNSLTAIEEEKRRDLITAIDDAINQSILLSKNKDSIFVKTLQSALSTLNYNIITDGDFGNITHNIVQKFQTDNQLTSDGIVGNQTWKKLKNNLENNITLEDIDLSDDSATWDHHTNRRIKLLHPLVRPKARQLINAFEKHLDKKVRVTSGYRSFEEQNELYAHGRSQSRLNRVGLGHVIAQPRKNLVTNAKAGESYHNYGLSIDVVEIRNGIPIWNQDWTKMGEIGKALGFQWGGDWTGSLVDNPHFQMTFGLSTSELLTLYNAGERDGKFVTIEE